VVLHVIEGAFAQLVDLLNKSNDFDLQSKWLSRAHSYWRDFMLKQPDRLRIRNFTHR